MVAMRRNPRQSDQKTESTCGPRSPNLLDPELSSYFLIRRRTHDSSAVSPRFTPLRVREHKSTKSLKSQMRKSGESNRSKNGRVRSPSSNSALSESSKYRHIAEWNDKSIESQNGMSAGDLTPSSFELQRHPVDPPRPPKAGLEWVWFPEGYWAEREFRDGLVKKETPPQKWWSKSQEKLMGGSSPASAIGDKSPSKSKPKRGSPAGESSDKSPSRLDVPEIKVGSVVSRRSRRSRSASAGGKPSRKSSKVGSEPNPKLGGFSFGTFGKIETNSGLGTPSQKPEPLGLYCRTKQHIRNRLIRGREMSRVESGKDSVVSTIGWGSRTTTVLEGASNYFYKMQREEAKMGLSTPTLTPAMRAPTSPEIRPRRAFGLAPWHRRNSNESLLSVSSSVHQLLMGKTPAATPVSESRYAGHEGKTYPAVDISSPDPHEPTFLPSEAKRINTPPMSPGTPTVGARGLFFDLQIAAKEEAESPGSLTTIAGSGSASGRVVSSPREWWEAYSKQIEASSKTSRPGERHKMRPVPPSAFELSLPPEHLPSSPLCPKNPMHQSGGNGICPFHGRRRSVGLKVIRRVNTGTTDESVVAM